MRRSRLLITPVLFLLSNLAHAQSSYTFSGKPTYDILAKQNNTVMGTMRIELFPLVALKHTINFDSLVSFHFYDTTAFHRAVPHFVIQGGDPNSRHGPTNTWGYGNPSQPTVPAEFTAARYERGMLGAARSFNINSATSQFFITVDTAFRLDGKYTLYGRVVSGMSVADAIVAAPQNTANNMPNQKIEMFVTRVGSNDSIPDVPQLLSLPNGTTNIFLSDTVKLAWQHVGGAVLYEVQLATDPQFTSPVDQFTVGLPELAYTNHQWMTTYYWRVRANNGGKKSAYSEAWNFTTEGDYAGLNSISGYEPFRWSDLGNGTLLVTGLHDGQYITLYDLSGRVIRTMEADADRRLTLTGIPKGLYLLRASEQTRMIKTQKVLIR